MNYIENYVKVYTSNGFVCLDRPVGKLQWIGSNVRGL